MGGVYATTKRGLPSFKIFLFFLFFLEFIRLGSLWYLFVGIFSIFVIWNEVLYVCMMVGAGEMSSFALILCYSWRVEYGDS